MAASNDAMDATAMPGPSRSPPGGRGASASPSPSSPRPAVVSTVASAGANNSYIWTKAGYFFGRRTPPAGGQPGEAETAELVAAGAGTVSPAGLRYYIRAVFIGLFVALVSLPLVNFLFLPVQLAALAWVTYHAHPAPGRRRVVWPRLALRVVEVVVAWWQLMVSALLERVMGMQLHTAGDVISEAQRREGALILSNHPSTADWMYLFSWLPRQGSLLHLKIVLKGALHGAPVIGWALQCCRYLFLERNWEKDQKHMECIVQHWAKAGTRVGAPTDDQPAAAAPVQLLLFPEGTDLRPVSFDQSAAFVAKSAAAGMQLIPFEHLLQPRVTGFVHLVKLLRSTGSVKAVYDLTLASTPVPVTIENLARGVAPEHFHVHLRRFDLAALPKDDAALAQWLLQRWTEKEKLLQGFYAQPATAVGAQQQRSFPRSDEQDALERRLARQMQLLHFSALFLFGLLGLLHLYALYARPLLLLFLHAALSGVWVWLSRSPHNGFDRLILHNDQAAEEQLQQPPQSTAPTNLVNKKAQ